MQDTASTNLSHGTGNAGKMTQIPGVQVHKAAPVTVKTTQRGLLMRMIGFIARLFGRKIKVQSAVTQMQAAVTAERAAASIAAGAEPPMVFRGDTANTLATPMGAYAGKPVEQAIRKRAEQQFKSFDTTTATMN